MDIQVGDKITYKNGFIEIMLNSQFVKQHLDGDRIVKIERPKYEIVEEKKEILDNVERQYLWNFVKPFRNRVVTITKEANTFGKYFISISLKDDAPTLLPDFKKDRMYKGIELNKEYTLQELGLEGD